jgi:hypothetical protein
MFAAVARFPLREDSLDKAIAMSFTHLTNARDLDDVDSVAFDHLRSAPGVHS